MNRFRIFACLVSFVFMFVLNSAFAAPSALNDSEILIQAAEHSFRIGRFDDAQLQIENLFIDYPEIAENDRLRRLQIFLALATGNTIQFDRLSKAKPSDPMIAYLIGLRRMSLRDYTVARKMFKLALKNEKPDSIRKSLLEQLSYAAGDQNAIKELPAEVVSLLPFACHGEFNGKVGWDFIILNQDVLFRLFDSGEDIDAVSKSVAYFFVESYEQHRFVGIDSDAASIVIQNTTLSLLLNPTRSKLLDCVTGRQGEHQPDRRNLYRLLFDLLIHIDDRPVSFRQAGYQYLSLPVAGDGTQILALEALHSLRAGLDRFKAMAQVDSNTLTAQQLQLIEERLLIYRLMAQAYLRLNRKEDGAQLAKIAQVIEKYISKPSKFPRKELRDRTGENLRHREGLRLRLTIANQNEITGIEHLLQRYDQSNTDEQQLVMRRIYQYR